MKASRIFRQASYIAGNAGKSLAAAAAVVALFASLASLLSGTVTAIALSSTPIAVILLSLLVTLHIAGMVDELNEGSIELFLAHGLNKREYLLAWYTNSWVLSTTAILVSTLVPLAVIDPSAIPDTLDGWSLAAAIIQVAILPPLLTATAMASRRRGAVITVGTLLSLVMLIIVPILASINRYLGLSISILTPYYGYIIAGQSKEASMLLVIASGVFLAALSAATLYKIKYVDV